MTRGTNKLPDAFPSYNSASPKRRIFSQFLDTNGDGTGTANANTDLSVGLNQFFIAPPAGQIYHIARVLVSIEDAGPMRAERYGGLAGALGNGVLIQKRAGESAVVIDFCGGSTIMTNAGWGTFCYDVDIKAWGAGDQLLLARWSFSRTEGHLDLVGDKGERLMVGMQDDFTGLVSHCFVVQGYVR